VPGSACHPSVREPYRLRVSGPASRTLEKLPDRIAIAIVEILTERLVKNPRRLGKPLSGSFSGLWVARVKNYRIRFWIDDDTRAIVVLHVAPRPDAYRPD
jgi:mRNA interferase RelE/StbE